MAGLLIAILLLRGGVEANPGPAVNTGSAQTLDVKNYSRTTSHMGYLQEMARRNGLAVKDNAGHGDCLYLAMADGLASHGVSMSVQELRNATAQQLELDSAIYEQMYLVENASQAKTFDLFVERTRSGGEWGTQLCLTALSHALLIPIRVVVASSGADRQVSGFQLDFSVPVEQTSDSKLVMLGMDKGASHYVCLLKAAGPVVEEELPYAPDVASPVVPAKQTYAEVAKSRKVPVAEKAAEEESQQERPTLLTLGSFVAPAKEKFKCPLCHKTFASKESHTYCIAAKKIGKWQCPACHKICPSEESHTFCIAKCRLKTPAQQTARPQTPEMSIQQTSTPKTSGDYTCPDCLRTFKKQSGHKKCPKAGKNAKGASDSEANVEQGVRCESPESFSQRSVTPMPSPARSEVVTPVRMTRSTGSDKSQTSGESSCEESVSKYKCPYCTRSFVNKDRHRRCHARDKAREAERAFTVQQGIGSESPYLCSQRSTTPMPSQASSVFSTTVHVLRSRSQSTDRTDSSEEVCSDASSCVPKKRIKCVGRRRSIGQRKSKSKSRSGSSSSSGRSRSVTPVPSQTWSDAGSMAGDILMEECLEIAEQSRQARKGVNCRKSFAAKSKRMSREEQRRRGVTFSEPTSTMSQQIMIASESDGCISDAASEGTSVGSFQTLGRRRARVGTLSDTERAEASKRARVTGSGSRFVGVLHGVSSVGQTSGIARPPPQQCTRPQRAATGCREESVQPEPRDRSLSPVREDDDGPTLRKKYLWHKKTQERIHNRYLKNLPPQNDPLFVELKAFVDHAVQTLPNFVTEKVTDEIKNVAVDVADIGQRRPETWSAADKERNELLKEECKKLQVPQEWTWAVADDSVQGKHNVDILKRGTEFLFDFDIVRKCKTCGCTGILVGDQRRQLEMCWDCYKLSLAKKPKNAKRGPTKADVRMDRWNKEVKPSARWPKCVDGSGRNLPVLSAGDKSVICIVHPAVTVMREFKSGIKYKQEACCLLKDKPDQLWADVVPRTDLKDRYLVIQQQRKSGRKGYIVANPGNVKVWLNKLFADHPYYKAAKADGRLTYSESALRQLEDIEELASVMCAADEEQQLDANDRGATAEGVSAVTQTAMESGMTSSETFCLGAKDNSLYLKNEDFLKLLKNDKVVVVEERNSRKQVYDTSANIAFPYLYSEGQKSPLDYRNYLDAEFLMKKQIACPQEVADEGQFAYPFAEDAVHLAHMSARLNEQRVGCKVGYLLTTNPEMTSKPIGMFTDALKKGADDHGELESKFPGLTAMLMSLKNSREFWFAEQRGLHTMALKYGEPNLFSTVNMESRHWPQVSYVRRYFRETLF